MKAGFGAGMWRELGTQWDALREAVGFGDALASWPAWLAPPLAVASLLCLVILAGLSLAALGTLLTTLLAAAFLLEQVFGVRVQLA